MLGCLALIGLWLTPLAAASAAGEAEGSGRLAPLGAVGDTVLAAIATSDLGRAVNSIGESLAMLEARSRVQARMRNRAATRSAPERPAVGANAGDAASRMPPASAGTNGTTTPHASSLRGELFAHARGSRDPAMTSILLTGVALAPPQAPEAVKGAINAANTIVGRPYVWGGGHASFYSNAYDCSGSVSFALFGGGLIPRPLTSSELAHWGAPGPGRWITVYANAGHTFAEIAGLRWDTVGDAQGTGPRWHLAPTSTAGFVTRHPPGY
jgi:hypothetical protein